MGHRPFKKPVFMKLNGLGTFQARSAWEALEYLDVHWPAEMTEFYHRAKLLCQEALDGNVDAETVRLAVIDAAQRADLLETGGKPLADGARRVFRPMFLNRNHGTI